MEGKLRRDFCIECRRETEYFWEKRKMVKRIREKVYTFEITVAMCRMWQRNEHPGSY